MLVKVMLETLVGKVDAELLKAVAFIIFKAKNVKNSDGQDLRKPTNKPTKTKWKRSFLVKFWDISFISTFQI